MYGEKVGIYTLPIQAQAGGSRPANRSILPRRIVTLIRDGIKAARRLPALWRAPRIVGCTDFFK